MSKWDLLLTNARLATMEPGGEPYGAIDGAAIAVREGKIAWLGLQTDLPQAKVRETIDLEGRWVTPGLIDCHTHLIHGGDRAAEFELRLKGATYEEIARAGGGIVSTVGATRAASEEELFRDALPRARALLAEGVTTLEIKSGYGLALDQELKQLRVARRLGESLPLTVFTTFLGAHAVPPEFKDRSEDYLQTVLEMLPQVAASGLADAVDAFCETIAFSHEQTARLFDAARQLGLPVKLHADQLSDSGGAALAARFGALSADHLEHTNEEGAAAMAKAGTIAVLLPGAFYFLRETKLPPVEMLRRHGVGIALSTDCNPGSSPATSLLLMLSMGCTYFRLTPEEALAAVTREAARALGLGASHGTLALGKVADLAVWDIGQPAELAYRIGFNPLSRSFKAGDEVDRAA